MFTFSFVIQIESKKKKLYLPSVICAFIRAKVEKNIKLISSTVDITFIS